MAHEGVITWAAERLGVSMLPLRKRRTVPDYYKPQFRFILFGKRAQLLCETLFPYLHVKTEHARIICNFPVDVRIAPGVKISHTDVNEVRYKLRDEIRKLNHRGPPKE